MLALIEVTLSWLFKNARGRDEKSFYRAAAFADHPEPTIAITSPECGPGSRAEPAQLHRDHSADGAGRIPSLEWTTPGGLAGKVKEWLLVVEDPDAPTPTPIAHGTFGGITVSKTRVDQADLEVVDDDKNLLKGGFHYGMCRRPVVYIPPRPLLNHGPHRYFYQIVALSEPLPAELLTSKPQPSREQVAEKIQGKVLGWGLWNDAEVAEQPGTGINIVCICRIVSVNRSVVGDFAQRDSAATTRHIHAHHHPSRTSSRRRQVDGDMNDAGESRESLDLLASAAEQSSPQARIKRNTACVSCRDSKVKCNSSAVPGQPCQRCTKLKLSCVVDKSHKRVSKRSKFEELVQEVQSIKQAVGPRTPSAVAQQGQQQLPLPPIPVQHGLQQQPLPPPPPSQQQQQQQQQQLSPALDHGRIYPAAPFPTSTTPLASISSFSALVPPRPSIPETPSVAGMTPGGQIPTPSSTATGRPSQPRALKSRVFASQDIDFYFEKYFEYCHPYLPIVRIREPDAIYNSGPLLFWVIMVTACRRTSHDGGVFDFLVDAVKSEVWEAVSDPPMPLATINALLILSAWPLPTIRFMKDPSPIYASMLMNSCYLLGIHTGRGDIPAVTYPAYRLSVSNEEALYTWVGYNIISQRISTYSGTPSTGQFFNSTIENILARTCPIPIPMYFHVLLESASFLHRLSRTMAACLEEGRGVTHHVVDHLVEDYSKIQRLLSADGVSDVDNFTILSTLLEVQVYYFVPVPNFNQETFQRKALQCHTTAQRLIQLGLRMQNELAFLSHAPHFVCRSVLSAACVIISCLISPSLKDLAEAHIQQEGTTPDLVVADALAAVRYCSIQEGDLPMRASKMMDSAWTVRNVLPPTELVQLNSHDASHRMGMGLPLECIRRWKRQMEQVRQEKVTGLPVPNAGAGGAAGSTGAGGADVSGAGGAGAGAGGVVDPTAMIDWDAFMKDFDWNFDPSLIDAVVA